MGLIGSALSGLNAAQAAISVVSHNTANVNTPGYTRQELQQTTNTGQYTGAGYVGNGAKVVAIRRVYDEFLTNQATRAQSESSYYNSYNGNMSQLMNAVGDVTTGLSRSFETFYKSMSDFSARIGEPAARQSALASSEALASRFRTATNQLDQLRNGVNQKIGDNVSSINEIGKAIARLNEQIGASPGVAAGQMPNDLLDQRDNLVRDLNKLVGATTSLQDGTQLNVYLSSGQPLVVGATVSELASENDPNSLNGAQLVLITSGKAVALREQDVAGGDLGAQLAFRNNDLAKAQDQLGEIALEMAAAYNAQNQFGLDANGAGGRALFTIGQPLAYGAKSNSENASMSINIADVRDMTKSDYQVRAADDGSGGLNYTITRASDGSSQTFSSAALSSDGTFQFDGMVIKPRNLAVGDNFTINTRRQAASGFETLTKNPDDLAGAAPMELVTGAANSGSGTISGLTSTSGTANYNTSIMVRFTSGSNYELLDATDANNPVPLAPPVTGTYAGKGATISHNGWSFELSGTPSTGDTFTVKAAPGDPTGDNRNATALGKLQTTGLLDGKTITQAYSSMVSSIGARANEVSAGQTAYATVLAQAIVDEQSAAGVNLNEEAAKLMRYQQAYSAAGKLLSAAQDMFSTLLAAVR